jgi:glycosyltransferase involved in cell wall biosynthesis
MKVSCLCITTAERELIFRDWVLWNYNKQDHQDRELVVVTDSPPNALCWPKWVKVARVYGNIPQKRNEAIRMASGDVITWFDDDDWQNESKCSVIVDNLRDGFIVTTHKSMMFDMESSKVALLTGHFPLFNSMGMYRKDAIEFDESIDRASDDNWMIRLSQLYGIILVEKIMHFWLIHNRNFTKQRELFDYNLSVNLDEDIWQQLRKLEARLRKF